MVARTPPGQAAREAAGSQRFLLDPNFNRIARRVNQRLGRRGKLFAQRYHARILRSPREVRHALVYVLNNRRHHVEGRLSRDWLDPCSSGPWFTGWQRKLRPHVTRSQGDSPVVSAETWLLEHGWRMKLGPLRFGEAPAT